MNYELGLFSNLARLTLCLSIFTEMNKTVETKKQMEAMMELEANRIRYAMNNVVYCEVSENKIRRYIRQNQLEICKSLVEIKFDFYTHQKHPTRDKT